MRIIANYIVAMLMLFCTGNAGASTPSQWPVNPSRLQLSTPYGELHVSPSDYVYESRLMLDDQDIEPEIKGLLNIPYAFSTPDFHVALISISTGDDDCPYYYKWIKLKQNGYTLTPRFGSCSESIRVSTKGTIFTMQTPSAEVPGKLDSYLYDGTNIKKENGR